LKHSDTHYRLFSAAVASALPLPGIPEAVGAEVDVRIETGSGVVDDTGFDWQHAWHERDGNLVLSCARRTRTKDSPEYILHFPDLADFYVTEGLVTCHPHPGCRDDSLRHLLLDQVIPRLWAHLGHLVLHASAVQLADGRVLAFTGESGWGKSTLAAALQARGARLLADDSVWLKPVDGRVQVVPSYTGLRLNDDSIDSLKLGDESWSSVSHYSAKRRLSQPDADDEANLWLDALFLMGAPGGTREVTMSFPAGADATATLIRRTFLLDVRDRRCATRQMEQAVLILRGTPAVCGFDYPRDFTRLTEVCDAIARERAV